MSRKDFVPDSAKNFRDWSENYFANATPQLTGLTGWDAARITALKDQLAPMRDAAQAVLDAQKALDEAVGALVKAKKDHLPPVRSESSNIKTSPGYDVGIGDVLGIVAGGSSFDPNTYKPVATAYSDRSTDKTMTPSHRFIEGNSVTLLATRSFPLPVTQLSTLNSQLSPDTPPATPGQAEQREYQFRGVIGDDEIGQPSDIVQATFTP